MPRSVETAILAHADEAAPDECCGLLIGREMSILEARPTRNVSRDPRRRYLIDPQEHLMVVREARRRELEVLGAYHSHPRSRAVPSEIDRAEGFGNFFYLVVGLGGPRRAEFSAWTWEDGNFTEVPLVRMG